MPSNLCEWGHNWHVTNELLNIKYIVIPYSFSVASHITENIINQLQLIHQNLKIGCFPIKI